jgi:hypothetical protein
MSQTPAVMAQKSSSPAVLSRLFLGAAASLAAAVAGTLTPVAPTAYAAGAMPHTSLPHTSLPHTSLPHTSLPHTSLPHTSLPTPAPGGGDRLTVTVQAVGGGADGTFELRCHPDGGNHPDVREACGRLDRRTTWGKDPFAPVPSGTVCTMQYGGPATAHVTGTWAGRPVDAGFERGNGCEIARWDAMVPVLPDVRL